MGRSVNQIGKIMKSKWLLALIIIVLNFQSFGNLEEIKQQKKNDNSFAIIVDDKTYENCKAAILKYRDAVENDGLSTFILIDKWETPEIVKSEIIRLYKSTKNLEGVVFVGDIPIPMVIKAQHMTSAYKLAEDRYPLTRTGVPSDRFYDDFDLKFKFILKDTVNQLQYYYSLEAESPQRIEREIYSARIIPQVADDSKYEMISNFLNKAADEKAKKNYIDNMFVYTGHGYYSNSLAGWADQRITLLEQFPLTYKAGNRIKHLNHQMSGNMKEILSYELQRKDLDIALFHAHGTVDMQLLNSYPKGDNPQAKIDDVKLYLRSKLRSAKDSKRNIDEAKEYFQKWLDVPNSWFDGAFEDSVIIADSLLNYSLDFYSDDIKKLSPQAKFVMFDECFNGSFHKPNYIAGSYIFNKNGNVIITEGNSVNSLQDKWPDEYLGMLNYGVRIGERHRLINMLESHLIGDPTFRFATYHNSETHYFDKNFKANDASFWEKQLSHSSPVIRELALRKMSEIKGRSFDKDLVNIYKTDDAVNVRLHALKFLAQSNQSEFHEVLKIAINDPNEIIRKFTSIWMGEIGNEDYLPYLMEATFSDESPRVPFNTKSAMSFINTEKAIEVTDKYYFHLPDFNSKENQLKLMINGFKRNIEWVEKEIMGNIKSDTLKLRSKLQEVKTFRNYRYHKVVPWLIEIAKEYSTEPQLSVQILETLGWFNLSYKKNDIIDFCNRILNDNKYDKSIQEEALRTKNRLLIGLNNLMIP